jgi:hypothetical protein
MTPTTVFALVDVMVRDPEIVSVDQSSLHVTMRQIYVKIDDGVPSSDLAGNYSFIVFAMKL